MKVISINNLYNSNANQKKSQNAVKQTPFGLKLIFDRKVDPKSAETMVGCLSDWYTLDRWFFSTDHLGVLSMGASKIGKKSTSAKITVFSPTTVPSKDRLGEFDYAYKMAVDYKERGVENKHIDLSVDGGLPISSNYEDQIENDPYFHDLGPYSRICNWLESLKKPKLEKN